MPHRFIVCAFLLSIPVLAFEQGSALPDLTVTLQPAGPGPTVDGSASYTATVRNAGTGAATRDVPVRLDFSSRWRIPSAGVGTGCTAARGATIVVTCQAGQLGAGASKTFTVRMDGPTQINGPSEVFTVSAAVDVGNQIAESSETNNSTHIDVTVGAQVIRPDLSVSLAGSPTTGEVGHELKYLVTVRNTGNGPAQNFVVRASLPRELDFVRTESNSINTCAAAGPRGAQVVTCTIPQLNASGSGTVTIVTKAIPGLGAGDQILFSVNVDPDKTVTESNENNNGAAAITTLSAPVDLEIVSFTIKTSSAPGAAIILPPGFHSCTNDDSDTLVRVRITNHGPGQSAPTEITMAWATGVFADGRGGVGGCPQGTFCNAGNCIAGAPPPPSGCFDRCTVPSLFPGATADVEFKAKRNKNVSFYGVAIIPSTGDTNPANNRKEIR